MANLVLGAGGAAAGAYTIDQSLRFNGADTPKLERTPTSAGDGQTFTISTWAKICGTPDSDTTYANNLAIFEAYSSVDNASGLKPTTNIAVQIGSIRVYARRTGDNIYWRSDNLFRDPSAWYHIVAAFDMTEGSAGDRIKIWINNEQITSWETQTGPPDSYTTYINDTIPQRIGTAVNQAGTWDDPDQYLAEYYLIDGQALTPASFAETDEDTNQWKPKDASGLTFGTNGFYLKFEDSADLGNDSSGEGNDFTVTNLDADDQFPDTPTNNFPTLNPLNIPTSRGPTISEVNLKATVQNLAGAGPYFGGTSTIALPASGKWYYEVLNVDYGAGCYGITSNQTKMAGENATVANYGYCYYRGGTLEAHGGGG